jgi:hypothetical protein
MAKMRKTPCPQKSSAKANAAVNKMKGAATTAPRPSDESDEAKVEVETVICDHPEAEQNNQAACSLLSKADEISGDDGDVIGCSHDENAASANAPKNSKAKKPSPSKRKTLATKAKKTESPSDDQVCWLRFSELCRYKANHGTMNVPGQKMVQTMYMRIGFIISGRGTKIMYCWLHTIIS